MLAVRGAAAVTAPGRLQAWRDDPRELTEHDREQVDAFRRFLALDLRPNGPRVEVPEEWVPYVLGTGPAPPAVTP